MLKKHKNKLKIVQKKILLIKSKLKIHFLWKDYKKKFPNKQTQFMISKIILLFNENIDEKELVVIEELLIKIKKNSKMFNDCFVALRNNELFSKISWDMLSYYLFYIYQISTFYKDLKNGNKNIYNFNNYVDLNNLKRKCFNEWAYSLSDSFSDFNFYVKKVLEWLL